MRVVLLHNWSTLGGAVGRALIESAKDELWLVAGPSAVELPDPAFAALAAGRGIPCSAGVDVASPAFLDVLRRHAPDLVLVATFPRKLPPQLLAVPRLGAWNVHASLLPAYRGAEPVFWAIRSGEASSGLTVHRMDAHFDAGPVLAQARLALDADETLGSLEARGAAAAGGLVLDLLARLRRGEAIVETPQDDTRATPAPALRPEHLAIRWEESAASVDRLLRACHPHHEPTTGFRGGRLALVGARTRARARPGGEPLGPGELALDREAPLLWVGAGEGAIAVPRLVLADEVVDALAFEGRVGLRPGERFD